MAARLTGTPPNRPEMPDARPVATKMGPVGGRKPLVDSTASPGTFCDAIVTMKSGRPSEPSVAGIHAGDTRTSAGGPKLEPPGGSFATNRIATTAVASAMGIA